LQVNLRLHKALFALEPKRRAEASIARGARDSALKLDGNLQGPAGLRLQAGLRPEPEGRLLLRHRRGSPPFRKRRAAVTSTPRRCASSERSCSSVSASIPKLAKAAPNCSSSSSRWRTWAAPSGAASRSIITDPNNDGKLTFAELSSPGLDFGKVFDARLGAVANVDLQRGAQLRRQRRTSPGSWPTSTWTGPGTWRRARPGPTINVDEVYLDLGSYISDFLGPVLGKLREFTAPADPDPGDGDHAAADHQRSARRTDHLPGPGRGLRVPRSRAPGSSSRSSGRSSTWCELVGNFDGKSLLIPMGAFEMIAGIGGGSRRRPIPTGKLLNSFAQDLDVHPERQPQCAGGSRGERNGRVHRQTGRLGVPLPHLGQPERRSSGCSPGNAVRLIEVRLPDLPLRVHLRPENPDLRPPLSPASAERWARN
jgi:hypothetical protein